MEMTLELGDGLNNINLACKTLGVPRATLYRHLKPVPPATKPGKWDYYHLYVVIVIYSRLVVDWMLARQESGGLARQLLKEAIERQGVQPGQLTIHSDRGAAMQSKPVVALLSQLDVLKTNSRPRVSNDNPFSESQFKTTKYHPEFPERFGSFEHALTFLRTFMPWYDEHHCH